MGGDRGGRGSLELEKMSAVGGRGRGGTAMSARVR